MIDTKQKAKDILEEYANYYSQVDLEELAEHLDTIKVEAYKEFADKIKKWKYQSSDWSHGEHPFVIEESDIDEVLTELVGEDNES